MKRFDIKSEECISVKRMYLPVVFKKNCTKCNESCEIDLSSYYPLGEPFINKKETMTFVCDKCDNEFDFEYILRVGFDVDKSVDVVEQTEAINGQ